MKNNSKEELFERTPVPKAVASLAIPTVAACLVMVLYNLADTYFVGKLNDPVETSAVTLAAPVLLAFNAVTNLFGTGCSSMMSRSLGVKDYAAVRKSSALGFYCAILRCDFKKTYICIRVFTAHECFKLFSEKRNIFEHAAVQ